MKSGIFYLVLGTVSILLAVIGFPAYLAWHVATLGLDDDGVLQEAEKQFLAPGEVQVELEKPGHHMVWLHYRTTFQNETHDFPPEVPPDAEFELEEVETGIKPSWTPFGEEVDFTVEVSGVARKNVGAFEVTVPGEYRLTVSGDFEPRVFSMATEPMDALFTGIGTLFVVAVILGLAGVGFIIFGIIILVRSPR